MCWSSGLANRVFRQSRQQGKERTIFSSAEDFNRVIVAITQLAGDIRPVVAIAREAAFEQRSNAPSLPTLREPTRIATARQLAIFCGCVRIDRRKYLRRSKNILRVAPLPRYYHRRIQGEDQSWSKPISLCSHLQTCTTHFYQ